VLLLHQFDLNFAGGSGVYLRALADELRAVGHEVDVVTARQPDQYGCTTHELPFDFTLTFGPEKRDGERMLDELSSATITELAFRAAASIAEAVFRPGPPDLIVANHISLMAQVSLSLSSGFGVPYRLISYGTDTQLLDRDNRYVDLFGAAAAGADRVFAISGYVARQLRASLPVRDVEILGGAVDKRLFYPPADFVDPGARIAFVGRLVSEKGIWSLLEAVSLQRVHTHLDIIGEGPLQRPIAAHLAGSPLQERIRLLGYVPPSRLREALFTSALLVVPSTWQEPLGLVVLEAMACGIPVVASAVGGLPEMVVDGFNGRLVEPGDAAGLAATLDELMSDAELRARLRENCLHRTPIASYRELACRVLA
jgi:glycosyltransferase involved in cell wall biosynthesis